MFYDDSNNANELKKAKQIHHTSISFDDRKNLGSDCVLCGYVPFYICVNVSSVVEKVENILLCLYKQDSSTYRN